MLCKSVQSFSHHSMNDGYSSNKSVTSGNELQKLGDDCMDPAVTADPLLGEESLFNDSLDDVHVHEKAIRAALTDVEETAGNEREHSLDDSLDCDMTQLPFDDVASNSCLNLISRGSSNQGDAKSTSGFQVAVQIPLTRDNRGTSKVTDEANDINVSEAVEDTTHGVDEQYPKPTHDHQQMENSMHMSGDTSTMKKSLNTACSDSSVSKSSKLVPSFGRRKNKTTQSPPVQVDTKELPVELYKLTPSVVSGCQATGKEDTSGEKGHPEGDQCVPETTAKAENPSHPTFTGKNKQNATGGEREQDKSDNKDPGENTSSTSVIPRKEKKLTATQEQKKQEKEEKRKEAERKKLEREKKKKETEEKKAEKERLKKERQLELERKRAEREQKKIEQVLKKAESKDGKQTRKRTAKKANKENGGSNDEIITESAPVSQSKSEGDVKPCSVSSIKLVEDTVQSNGNKNIAEEMQPACEGVTQPQENASLPETSKSLQPHCESLGMNRADGEGQLKENSMADLPLERAEMEEACSMACEEVQQREGNDEPSDDARELSSQDKENDGPNEVHVSAQGMKPQDEKIKIVFGPTSKNAQKKTDNLRVNSSKDGSDVSKTKTAVNIKNTPKAFAGTKSKKTCGSTAAKKKVASKGTTSTTSNLKATKSKLMKRTCPQGSDVEPVSKRSKPANYTGPVWVQCERSSCKKWRQLRECTDPLSLPESWNCTMNTGNEWNEPCTEFTYTFVCIHVHICTYMYVCIL